MSAKITHGCARMWHNKRRAGENPRPSFYFFGTNVLGGAAHFARSVHQLSGRGVRLAGAVREI